MELSYKKHDNEKLFDTLEKSDLGLKYIQNYIPIYSKFFELTDKNWNTINLNNDNYICNITSHDTINVVKGNIKNITDKQKIEQLVFFKYSPLLDPVKYIIGKYDISDPTLLTLPSFINPLAAQEKTIDMNNSAYVDSFFSFLTSKLLHTFGFLNGIDFYGSFISIKENYPVNVIDDIDYINDFDFFHKNINTLFTVDDLYKDLIVRNDTRNYKKKINVDNNDNVYLNASDISDLEDITMSIDTDIAILTSNVTNLSMNMSIIDNDATIPDVIYDCITDDNVTSLKTSTTNSSCSSCSSCSSRSSVSSKGDDNMDIDDNADDNADDDADDADDEDMSSDYESSDYDSIDGDSNDDNYSEESNDVFVQIKEFPVQIIALEKCVETLHGEYTSSKMVDKEMDSVVLQILMSLITFQNTFHMTHNDLHSNNIMHTTTNKEFVYYKVDNSYYKVPTFYKIYKIIDFGRAIYKFKGQLMCSDSFHPKGDAATQYNFPPYLNPKKPVIEPNFSFDLCRLACSLYDEIVYDISEESSIKSPILQIILGWCKDDKGRNILYKKNGDERYPDFKLYKMISRKVHKHIPINVLRNPYFDKYKISKKNIGKDKHIINIDAIPSYI